jgi:hypothetical protein
LDEHMEERFLKPAISPDAALVNPEGITGSEIDASTADRAEQIGMTPAMARVDTPAQYAASDDQPPDPTKRLSGVLRTHLRQSAAVSDRMRGVNIQWQTNDIPKESIRPIPSGVSPGAQSTSARVQTFVRGRDGEPSARSLRAPMDRVLAGTVRRMVQQDTSYRRPYISLAHESHTDDQSPITEKLPTIDPNANATARITGYLQQLSRDSFEMPKIDAPIDIPTEELTGSSEPPVTEG